MPGIFFRSKILLTKIETVYGTDPVPTGAANALQVIDIKIMPMEGQDQSRDLDQAFLAAEPTIPVGLHQKISFKVEMQTGGALGVAPAWGPLMRACGCAQVIVATTSVTYSPVSAAMESVTMYLSIGGTLYKISGARGTVKMTVNSQNVPYLEFEFTGLFSTPTEAARPTPVYSQAKPLAASKTNTPVFTLNGLSLVMGKFSFDLGCQVEPRLWINTESIMLVDRSEMIEVTVEAEPLSTINPFALSVAQTNVPVVLQHGVAAGFRTTVNVPLAQLQRLTAIENSQSIKEWPLKLVPQPNVGNDQFTIVLT